MKKIAELEVNISKGNKVTRVDFSMLCASKGLRVFQEIQIHAPRGLKINAFALRVRGVELFCNTANAVKAVNKFYQKYDPFVFKIIEGYAGAGVLISNNNDEYKHELYIYSEPNKNFKLDIFVFGDGW